MSFRAVLASFVCAGLLGACAFGNQMVAKETAQSINAKLLVGKTTRQDVVQMFGQPSLIEKPDAWFYQSVTYRSSVNPDECVFWVYFDKADRVSNKRIGDGCPKAR